MRIYGDRVYLEAGELVPVRCRCGHLYQPPRESLRSFCMRCGRSNEHSDQEWEHKESEG